MTPENNPQRPTQHLEYEPVKKMETGPEEAKTPGTASKALGTVTGIAARIQQFPMVAHLIRATERFNDRMGNQFGAAITYFSFPLRTSRLQDKKTGRKARFSCGEWLTASHLQPLHEPVW